MLVKDIRRTARTVGAHLALPLLVSLTACESAPANASSASSEAAATEPAARVVVDSARPMPELIARFQAASGSRPESLAGGSPAIEPLVRRYVTALQRSDTGTLRELAVSRAEYAHLVFPGSVMARPPYELDPEVAWMLLVLESEKGLGRALALLEARRVAYSGFRCPEPVANGGGHSWRGCSVALRLADGSTRAAQLFGEIVEVGGRHKFLSYANPLPPTHAAH